MNERMKPFFKGAAQILDFMGILEPINPYDRLSSTEADARTIERDWEMIGRDLWNAIKIVEEDLK